MQKLQDVFNRVRETKKEHKDIQKLYKDSLEASKEYKEAVEKLKEYRSKKIRIENEVKAELGQQYDKYEQLKKDIELDKELLADIAISSLMKGETVQVKDENEEVYEPIFSVTFKKANSVDKQPR